MKYCWEYTDDYLEYRNSLGLDTKNPRWYIKDFSRYLKFEFRLIALRFTQDAHTVH